MDGEALDLALLDIEWEQSIIEREQTDRMSTPLLIEWIDRQLFLETIQQKGTTCPRD